MPIEIHFDEINKLLEEGAILLEVLPRKEYAEQHLPGAVNMPLKEMNQQSTGHMDWARPVITYCAGSQ